jgi:Asp-tRNA(Asn)/Glu-tRNA(Gln) amidotransferase A subunit family amidase
VVGRWPGSRQDEPVDSLPGGAVALRNAIAAGSVSPVEAVQASLDAIEARNGELNAFLAVDGDAALAAARRAEQAVVRGEHLGPLHGVPVGVKDVEDTADLDTTYGSARYAGHRPAADSPFVAALRAAGAVVVGKTNTPAFALLGETWNDLRDDCRNPWDPRLTGGGSSGGSAVAVAAGLVPLATGTDYGGSIPAPAAFCGVVGVKATHERVAGFCGGPGSGLFDSVGPLAGSVADAALLLEALGVLAPLRGPRGPVPVAWAGDLGRYPVDPEVLRVARRAAARLEDLGCRVVDEVPALPDPWPVFAPLCAADLRLLLAEATGGSLDGLAEETRAELAAAPELTRDGYVGAVRRLQGYRAAAAAFLQRFPVVATPATAVAAFPVRRPPERIAGRPVPPGWHGFMPFQVPWNLTGGPVVTVPAGRTADGRPVGLQLAAAPHADELLLALAARYEQAVSGGADQPGDDLRGQDDERQPAARVGGAADQVEPPHR